MSEGDQILSKMEYQTYRILKDKNDQQKNQIEENKAEISRLNDEIIKLKMEKENMDNEFMSQEEEMNNLEKTIKVIRTNYDTQIYGVQNKLSSFTQRYSKQEQKNESTFQLYQFRKPNRYFCDIEKSPDGIIFVRVFFHQGYTIKHLDNKIQKNLVDIVVCLENNEISHIIKHRVQFDQQNMKCLATGVQRNEVTFQFGQDS